MLARLARRALGRLGKVEALWPLRARVTLFVQAVWLPVTIGRPGEKELWIACARTAVRGAVQRDPFALVPFITFVRWKARKEPEGKQHGTN